MDRQEYINYEPFLARRAWAAILDYNLFGGILYGYMIVFGTVEEGGRAVVHGAIHFLPITVLWVLYFPVMEGVFGFTLFKGVLDLKIMPDRSTDSRVLVALKRHLLDPIDFLLFGIVAIVLVKTRDDHKRLGDIIAHSIVVRDRDEIRSAA
jgi:uncharacterized RDD family membrane protein YckC